MAKRRKKIGTKNRNIIMGLLVSIASIYAVVSYLGMSRQQVSSFFLSTLLFFVVIIVLAVITVGALKVIGRLGRGLFGKSGRDNDHDKDQESDKE